MTVELTVGVPTVSAPSCSHVVSARDLKEKSTGAWKRLVTMGRRFSDVTLICGGAPFPGLTRAMLATHSAVLADLVQGNKAVVEVEGVQIKALEEVRFFLFRFTIYFSCF